MKNRFLLFLLLLGLGCQTVSAAEVDAATRQKIGKVLSRIVDREIAHGYVRVEGVNATKKRVQIFTSIGLSYYPFREDNLAAMRDSVRALLPSQYRKASIELYSNRNEVGQYIPMADRKGAEYQKLLRNKKIIPFVNRSQRPLVSRKSWLAAPTEGLSGRHIAIWQSHGRYFEQNENQWKWQRWKQWMTCEDLYTQSYVLPYLVPMLENAGAYVMLPRERDVQKIEVLADNDDETQYAETNGSQRWQFGGIGFAHNQSVYRTGENPFRDGTTRRVQTVKAGAESRAQWRTDIPEEGEYALYVSYETVPKSTDDARYTVHHLGGESQFEVNQTMGGGTWIYLGRFSFAPGEQTVVTLTNRSRNSDRIVTADAVKIGGGYGNVARTVCDSLRLPGVDYPEETSGYPRSAEGARYWLQWAGFDEKVYTPKDNVDDYRDDYMSRAHWVNALMGGSERLPDSTGLNIPIDMALAFHSDAGVRDNDDIIGTLGIFFTRENNGRFAGGANRFRSRDLTDLVMSQVTSDIRHTYEPNWTRRELWNRAYYEARVPGAPTMLLELLSHQNFADMRYGTDPRFKFLVSRAVYKGILQYISSQYQTPYVVQPLPVEALAVKFDSDEDVTLSWSAVIDTLEESAIPNGYIVYTRTDEGAFDNGRYTDQPLFRTRQEPGHIYSYQVTAVNKGGESFPSEIVSACRVPNEKGMALVVNGFDRISAPLSMRRDSLVGFYLDLDSGVADRQDISFVGEQRVYDITKANPDVDSLELGACYNDFETDIIGGNTFDYPYQHGRSIVKAGYSFCSSSALAVAGNADALTPYRVVDLILGKQRSTTIGRGTSGYEFKTFSPDLQQTLRRYVADGGALFVSGCYLATDLWTGDNTSDEDRAFAKEVLHYTSDGDLAAKNNRARIVAAHSDFRHGEFRFITDFRPDRYRIERVDALKPVGAGAFAVMRYADNTHIAAVAYAETGRTFVMGFPFESIDADSKRDLLMREVLNFLFASGQ